MKNNYLWKFHWDCGRQGTLESLFVATEGEVKDLIGRRAYFGEVLGKHSEIEGEIEESDIAKIDLDAETVEKVFKILGDTWSGYNPMEYARYECLKCGDGYCGYEYNKEKNLCEYCAKESEES